jgi:type IV pilus assembly protein PilO
METNKLQTAFNSFLENKVANLDKNQKIGICLAVVIIPIVAFYFLSYSKNVEVIKQLEENVAKMHKEIATVKAQAAKLDQHLAAMKETEIKFKEASLVIPDTKEIPSLLTNISGQASGAGLSISSFIPKKESPKQFYAEIPVSLKVNGTYHNVGFFLDSVSKLPRIVNVSSLSLGGAKEVEGEVVLNSSVELVTYKFIEPKNDGKPTPKKKKK